MRESLIQRISTKINAKKINERIEYFNSSEDIDDDYEQFEQKNEDTKIEINDITLVDNQETISKIDTNNDSTNENIDEISNLDKELENLNYIYNVKIMNVIQHIEKDKIKEKKQATYEKVNNDLDIKNNKIMVRLQENKNLVNKDNGFITNRVYGIFDNYNLSQNSMLGVNNIVKTLKEKSDIITTDNIESIIQSVFLKAIEKNENLESSYIFTINLCIEDEENYNILFDSDAYIIIVDNNNEVKFLKLNNNIVADNNEPEYYIYNYLNKDMYKKYMKNNFLKRIKLSKKDYKAVFLASNEISKFINVITDENNQQILEFKKLLSDKNEEKLLEIFEKYKEQFNNNVTICG